MYQLVNKINNVQSHANYLADLVLTYFIEIKNQYKFKRLFYYYFIIFFL